MRTIIENVTQIDPVLGEDHKNVGFYAWTDDDDTLFWSISLPMEIEEDAFDSMIAEWRQLAWLQLMRL